MARVGCEDTQQLALFSVDDTQLTLKRRARRTNIPVHSCTESELTPRTLAVCLPVQNVQMIGLVYGAVHQTDSWLTGVFFHCKCHEAKAVNGETTSSRTPRAANNQRGEGTDWGKPRLRAFLPEAKTFALFALSHAQSASERAGSHGCSAPRAGNLLYIIN